VGLEPSDERALDGSARCSGRAGKWIRPGRRSQKKSKRGVDVRVRLMAGLTMDVVSGQQ